MRRTDAWAMVQRRVEAAGIAGAFCCHSFRATGITTFLENGGSLETAQYIAGHADSRTTKLYDRRAEQKTPAFRERYRRRAGIEATFSHLVNVHRARRTPYCGSAKTLCYYAALAVGVNLRRVALWEAGQRPQRERVSCLCRLFAIQNAENQNAQEKTDGDC